MDATNAAMWTTATGPGWPKGEPAYLISPKALRALCDMALRSPDLDAVIEATIREIDDLTTKQINATNAMLKAEARAREKDTRRFQYLQNIPKTEAQAFFWNFDSRRQ